jgi:tRNA G18 (ribose-2'-O)-methylase SpoU
MGCNVENPMVNYSKLIAETASNHYNVRDEYKENTLEQNVAITISEQRRFSVGCINITGELNIGMMIRSACLLGAENFYIFGRKKFDKRSTVGAEKYINIVQYAFDDPIHADTEINERLEYLLKWNSVVLCEHGGKEVGSYQTRQMYKEELENPVFVFGSESHGLPDVVAQNPHFYKVSIPQRGVLRSFNVSAAMNIIVWDYIKEMYL